MTRKCTDRAQSLPSPEGIGVGQEIGSVDASHPQVSLNKEARMKKIRRDGTSRRPQSVMARLSLIALALALVVGPGVRTAAAQTQTDIVKQLSEEGVPDLLLREWLESQPNAEDIKLAEAELEIYKILPSAKAYDTGEKVIFLVGARNLGKQPAAFDYALSLDGSYTAPWQIQKGVVLSAGDQTFTGFVIEVKYLVQEYWRNNPEKKSGPRNVCFSLWLLKQGSKDSFRDRNMPNHQKTYCVEVMIITL